MNILIDVGHPAHVHLFKNFARIMLSGGHNILFTCREKEFERELLNSYQFDYKSIGKNHKSKLGKIWGIVEFGWKIFRIARKFKADIFLSHGSIYAAHVSWILKKPHISFEDTFNFEQIRLYGPFTDVILTGGYSHPELKNNINFDGYHELAYLHPRYFRPDKRILDELGVSRNGKYVLLRFVSWNASHDIGQKGITLENKIKAVEAFSKYAKVFISSEKELPESLRPFQIVIPPEKMHDVMAFASLIYGESGTMISEGAVLGVPGIYLDDVGRLYTREQEEKYQLVFNYSLSSGDQDRSIEKGIELLRDSGTKDVWHDRIQKMIKEKIDVTEFSVWFVENYPQSVQIMSEDPEYPERFRAENE